jgi:protocatechuate 3,4-dioxygenase, beta subunit
MTDALRPKAFADHPAPLSPDYRSTAARSPQQPAVALTPTLSELTGPGPAAATSMVLDDDSADLVNNARTGTPAIGPRTIVVGRVVDEHNNGIPGTLVEVWQADAQGRYPHWRETGYPIPLDPNFTGVGRCVTDGDGAYRFFTVKPGPYPWGNHPNAWRPAHIHFSVLGPALGSRLVTQMYFPGDPLLDLDPIFQAVPAHSRHRLVSTYDHSVTEENWALGYRFDLVIRGPHATPESH